VAFRAARVVDLAGAAAAVADRRRFMNSTSRRFVACAIIAMLIVPLRVLGALDQETFRTPEEAVSALEQALKSNDDAALIAIFGNAHKELVVTPDEAENRELRANALAEFNAYHMLEETSPDRRVLRIGDEAWPMPIPLVRTQGAWRFATEEGEQEVLDRRIGANEREAIKVMRAYVDAQREYATRDRVGDGVLQYARKLGSTPGKRDGLYWPADESKGEEASPFGPLIAASANYLKDRNPGDAYHGYYFRILTRQGKHAAGGPFTYIINGRMLAGFAMAAYPAQYGSSGVMTFVVNNNGVVYQKNRGASAKPLTEFDPDASWSRVREP
jgi:hypothetical protein